MKRSLLGALVNGTRQMLTAQLIVSVVAVALAGWTLAVTSNLMRERDRLRDRVIQLEQSMATSGVVVPAPPTVVDEPAAAISENAYPGEVGDGGRIAANSDATVSAETAAPVARTADLRRVLGGLFAPPPPLRMVVLHVRDQADLTSATTLARELTAANMDVRARVMTPRDPRQSGYTYFDGRQSSAAADLVTRFNELARQQQIAAWSAQLRGVALPAQGEYTTDRVDIVLPALPSPPAPPQIIEPPNAAATAPVTP